MLLKTNQSIFSVSVMPSMDRELHMCRICEMFTMKDRGSPLNRFENV